MSYFTIQQAPKPQDLVLVPNAAGCHTDLTKFGAATNWQCVDDPVEFPDGDATYNFSSATDTHYDLYGLSNHTTETGTINYIRTFARVKSHIYAQSSSGIYKILITDNACTNIYKTDDIDLTTGYLNYSNIWTTNPRTSVAWTWANIDSLQIGCECSSPTVTNELTTLTLRPTGDDAIELTPGYYAENWEHFKTWSSAYVYWDTNTVAKRDLYDIETTALTGLTIKKVTVWIAPYVRWTINTEDAHAWAMLGIGIGEHESDEVYVANPNSCGDQASDWVLNPDTGVAWTWADIAALKIGHKLKIDSAGGGEYIRDKECKLVVSYYTNANPEIRTTQMYVNINFTPPDSTCYLTRPTQISRDHARNVKMLNFWNGDREVYGLSRKGKTMVLMGAEHGSSACDRILCVKTMGKDGSIITVSQLGFAEFNGEFRIKQFGWKKVSEKPLHFTWILELEDAVL